MTISNIFRRVYFSDTPLSADDYRRSRNAAILESATARALFNLTSGAFLAGYASFLGADDSFNGLIGAIPALAGVIQVISPMVFEKLEKRKFLISVLCLLHRMLLGLMVLIPFVSGLPGVRLFLLAAFFLVSYLSVSFINPAVSGWIIDLAPDNIRGRYFSLRESYTLVFATVLTLVMGKVLDIFKESDRFFQGFEILFSTVIVLALANFVFLGKMKEPPVKRSDEQLDIKNVLTTPLKDKSFIKIVILFILWNIGLQIGGPFVSVYMVTGLKLEYTYIMIMGLITSGTMMIVVRIWGKIADLKSWSFVTKASLASIAVCHTGWMFAGKDIAFWMIPLLHFIGGIAWAGLNICLFNIQFQYSPEKGRTVYIGFNAAAGGLVGFLSTLAGSALLKLTGGFHVDILGVGIGNMQLLFGLSGVILLICALYTHFFIKERSRTAE